MPPMPGKMPSVVSGTPKTAVSPATMKSDRIASSQPPASAKPSTAAMTGTGQRSSAHRRLLEDHVLRAPRLVGHPVALLEIAAGAEGAIAPAGEDDDAHVGIGGERGEAREQILAHRGVHRVVLLRAIERDRDDVAIVGALDEQVAIVRQAVGGW